MSELDISLYRIFSEYSVQGISLSQTYIRFNKLCELCRDISLFTTDFGPSNLQLIFHSTANRSPNAPFGKFCEMIPKIIECTQPKDYAEDPSEAFDSLLNEKLLPLSREISQKRSVVQAEDLNLSNNVILICKNLHNSYRELYKRVFTWELSATGSVDVLFDRSLRALERILKEFELYPNILSKSKITGIWRDLVIMQDNKFQELVSAAILPKNCPEIGTVFTLSKFILVFYICSVYGCQDASVKQGTNTEKYLGLLERVQMSLPRTRRNVSFWPTPEVLSQIKRNEERATSPVEGLEDTTASSQQENVLEEYYHRLLNVFNEYCVRGHSKVLGSYGFHRLLRDSGLLEGLKFSSVDANLVYARLGNTEKLDFLQFLKALELLTKKLRPRSGLREVLKGHVLKLERKDQSLSKLLDSLAAGEFFEVLSVLQFATTKEFNLYCDSTKRLQFKQFLLFCKDFELFPDVVSQARVSQIFQLLAVNSEQQDSVSTVAELVSAGDSLSQRSFIKALAVVASDLACETDQPLTEKICYLIERLCQRRGPQHPVGRMVALIRNKDPATSALKKPSFLDLASKFNCSN